MPDPTRPDGAVLRRSTIRSALVLVALSLTLNLAGNARIGLWDRDEPRYAGAVREMRARGDWVEPTFNGQPRHHKPILIYWVIALSTALGGDNPFGARLGSALAGTASALLCWWLGRRMLGPSPAFLGALALITSPVWITESKLATTDATLALFLIGAQCCLWELSRRDAPRVALAFWACLGLAFLTKGPVGPGLIAAAGVASWWFGGPTDAWRRLRWRRGLGVFAMIALPWYVLIGVQTHGAFYRFALGGQLVERIRSGQEEHGGFPGYYLAVSLLAFYPWSAMVPAAVAAAWTRRRASPALGFLLGWAVGPLIVLELVKTKLIHYYLPAFPALALLVGWLVVEVSRDVVSFRRLPLGRLALALLGGIGLAGTAGFLASAFLVPVPLRSPCLALAAVLMAGTLVALGHFQRGTPVVAARTLAATWAGFSLVFAGWFLPAAEPYRLSRRVGERLRRLAEAEGSTPALFSYQEPGLIYAMGRTAPTIRDWDSFRGLLLDHPRVVTALTPQQADLLSADPRFLVEIVEAIDGFDVNKAKAGSIRLARVRLSPSVLAAMSAEERQVK